MLSGYPCGINGLILITRHHLSEVAHLQVSELDGYHCNEPDVSHSYKYKLLRAAFANLPTLKDTNNQIRTKVMRIRHCSSGSSTSSCTCCQICS